MHLHHLALRDFRNYETLRLELGPGTVVFHGPNGAGKTNLLEAVHLSSTGESPRAREAAELVRVGQSHTFVSSQYAAGPEQLKLELGLAVTGQRQIKVNGLVRRRTDLIGLAPVVHFSADDIVTLRGEPSGRRRLLDTELSNLSHSYYSHLLRYRRTLEQRNRLLKDLRAGKGRTDDLAPWDRAAARYGARVMVERADFIAELNVASAHAQARLTGEAQEFAVEYRPSLGQSCAQEPGQSEKTANEYVEPLAQALEEALREHRGADLGAGLTTIGPHRDDFEVLLNARPVRSYGSQGQQRAAALSVRLGLAEVAQRLTGERPVLLLDDVLSELDERYRAGVFAACAATDQAIITCCDPADVPAEARARSAVFEVCDGRIV